MGWAGQMRDTKRHRRDSSCPAGVAVRWAVALLRKRALIPTGTARPLRRAVRLFGQLSVLCRSPHRQPAESRLLMSADWWTGPVAASMGLGETRLRPQSPGRPSLGQRAALSMTERVRAVLRSAASFRRRGGRRFESVRSFANPATQALSAQARFTTAQRGRLWNRWWNNELALYLRRPVQRWDLAGSPQHEPNRETDVLATD